MFKCSLSKCLFKCCASVLCAVRVCVLRIGFCPYTIKIDQHFVVYLLNPATLVKALAKSALPKLA